MLHWHSSHFLKYEQICNMILTTYFINPSYDYLWFLCCIPICIFLFLAFKACTCKQSLEKYRRLHYCNTGLAFLSAIALFSFDVYTTEQALATLSGAAKDAFFLHSLSQSFLFSIIPLCTTLLGLLLIMFLKFSSVSKLTV